MNLRVRASGATLSVVCSNLKCRHGLETVREGLLYCTASSSPCWLHNLSRLLIAPESPRKCRLDKKGIKSLLYKYDKSVPSSSPYLRPFRLVTPTPFLCKNLAGGFLYAEKRLAL
jgi:hypothetical protein